MHEIAARARAVPGIEAVALGGSRARGTQREDSDVDLGLYYDAQQLDLAALTEAASEVCGHPVDVAGPGGWGPWVDGGAWLTVDGTAVDLILRDIDRVHQQRDRAIHGQFAVHAQTGHPLGFLDITYAAEVASCRALVDPTGLIERLREGLTPYPSALRASLIENLWSASFVVAGARKGAEGDDVAYVQLCCATALMWCAHAWHAAAGVWVTNEKNLVPAVAGLPIDTQDFAHEAQAALSAGDLATVVSAASSVVERAHSALRERA